MEHFEEYAIDPALPGVLTEETPEALEQDFHEHEERTEEAPSTDDPGRGYLREMGSVRLLNRQGEIDLARRMGRRTLRFRKSLSRSPLIWRSALALSEEAQKDRIRMEDFVDLGPPDDDERDKARAQAVRRLNGLARQQEAFLDLKRRIASTPERYVNVRAKLAAELPRLQVQCGRQLRSIPFNAA